MVTELNALKQSVAALTTKTDGLQTDITGLKTDVGTIETTVEQIAGQGGNQPGILPVKEIIEGDYNLQWGIDYYVYIPGDQGLGKVAISRGTLYVMDKPVVSGYNQAFVLPSGVVFKIKGILGSGSSPRLLIAPPDSGIAFLLNM